MKLNHFLQISATCAISVVSFVARADTIKGTILGSSVTAPALANHPANRDDTDTSTTINVTFFTYCPFITADAGRFPGDSFVFAGLTPGSSRFAPPVGLDVSSISPGDFTIGQYAPWILDNKAAAITAPSGTSVYQLKPGGILPIPQDDGGADILISYTPGKASDPTSVNFLQAYIQSFNGGAFSTGTIDAPPGSPYYNSNTIPGVTGTGVTNRPNTIPLVTNATTAAWMDDQPGDCESGNCVRGGPDDTLTSATVTFQTFIEGNKVCANVACGANKGKTYEVLYGGVQWGYTFTAVDTPPVPEPSYTVLLGLVFAGGWLGRRLRRQRVRAS